jgi:tRNA(fMet)-specific endonuclease VapC
MFVLDTNTVIYFFKGMGTVAERMLQESPRDISLPAIVLFELETGIAKSSSPEKRSAQLRDLLSAISIIPFGEKAATCSAQIRSRLEKEGRPIGPFDTLIAGTALAHSAVLVTHNTREFSRVTGLKIEDWF